MKLPLKKEKPMRMFGLLVLGLLVVGLFGFTLTFLWNWLMPDLFGLKEITVLQGFGLFALSKIIFGGFSGESNENRKTEKTYQANKVFTSNNDKLEKMNGDYEHVYDKWWTEKGETLFEQYVSEESENER